MPQSGGHWSNTGNWVFTRALHRAARGPGPTGRARLGLARGTPDSQTAGPPSRRPSTRKKLAQLAERGRIPGLGLGLQIRRDPAAEGRPGAPAESGRRVRSCGRAPGRGQQRGSSATLSNGSTGSPSGQSTAPAGGSRAGGWKAASPSRSESGLRGRKTGTRGRRRPCIRGPGTARHRWRPVSPGSLGAGAADEHRDAARPRCARRSRGSAARRPTSAGGR